MLNRKLIDLKPDMKFRDWRGRILTVIEVKFKLGGFYARCRRTLDGEEHVTSINAYHLRRQQRYKLVEDSKG